MRYGDVECEMVKIVVNCTTGNVLPDVLVEHSNGPNLATRSGK